jgi:hypothetical protein
MTCAPKKPRLRVIAGRPVVIACEEPRETPVEAARRRYGKPFAHERGAEFKWQSGPTVLAQWLAERIAARTRGTGTEGSE